MSEKYKLYGYRWVALGGASVRARMSMPAPMFPHGAQVYVKFPREKLFEVT